MRWGSAGRPIGRAAAALAVALLATLGAAAGASAGGFSTVGLSSLPDGVAPGEPWTVAVDVRSHGVAPVEWARPEVVIAPVEDGVEVAEGRRFLARPTAEEGIYRARVVFPSAGTWSYAVDEGFGLLHRFGTVEIGRAPSRGADAAAAGGGGGASSPSGGSSAGASGGPSTAAAVAIALVAGVAAAAGAGLVQRRRAGRSVAGAA